MSYTVKHNSVSFGEFESASQAGDLLRSQGLKPYKPPSAVGGKESEVFFFSASDSTDVYEVVWFDKPYPIHTLFPRLSPDTSGKHHQIVSILESSHRSHGESVSQ